MIKRVITLRIVTLVKFASSAPDQHPVWIVYRFSRDSCVLDIKLRSQVREVPEERKTPSIPGLPS